jgi:hypothetical protein
LGAPSTGSAAGTVPDDVVQARWRHDRGTSRLGGCGDERWYDVDCCVAAGQCCQAMTPLPKPYSVGNCLPVEVSERDD